MVEHRYSFATQDPNSRIDPDGRRVLQHSYSASAPLGAGVIIGVDAGLVCDTKGGVALFIEWSLGLGTGGGVSMNFASNTGNGSDYRVYDGWGQVGAFTLCIGGAASTSVDGPLGFAPTSDPMVNLALPAPGVVEADVSVRRTHRTSIDVGSSPIFNNPLSPQYWAGRAYGWGESKFGW